MSFLPFILLATVAVTIPARRSGPHLEIRSQPFVYVHCTVRELASCTACLDGQIPRVEALARIVARLSAGAASRGR